MPEVVSILLLGGTGFIGRHICQAMNAADIGGFAASFQPDTQFLQAFSPNIKPTQVGSTEMRNVIAKATHIIYLAHRSRPSSVEKGIRGEIESNVLQLADFLKHKRDINPNAPFIYTSSGGQIYGQVDKHPILENTSPLPVTDYGMGKLLNEAMLEYEQRTFGMKCTILRLANPVGSWQLSGSHGFVSAVVKRAIAGKTVTLYGDGHNDRDYFDADDLAEFIVHHCLNDTWVPGIFNIGSGIARNEKQVLAEVGHIVGRDVHVVNRNAREFDLNYAVLNPSQAQKILGWTSKTSFVDTVKKLISAVHATAGTS